MFSTVIIVAVAVACLGAIIGAVASIIIEFGANISASMAGAALGAICAFFGLWVPFGMLAEYYDPTLGIMGFIVIMFGVACLGAIVGAVAAILIQNRRKKEATQNDTQ